MIGYNPFNERLKKQYEEGLLHENYREVRTADAVWKTLNLFEEFTGKKDFTTFNTEQAKGFKRWLSKQENEKGVLLSLSTVRSTLKMLRDFFGWLALHPQCIRKVDGRAVGYLRLSNNEERAGRATREQPSPTVEEVHIVLEAMPHGTDVEKRDRAIIAFLALTAVRDAALMSLKVKDVDRAKREVWQDPKHVKTKNRKGINTFFMPFDPLWETIVTDWLDHIEAQGFCAQDALFPKETVVCRPETMRFESAGLSRDHWSCAAPVCEILKRAFHAVGLPYYRPHSFRKMLGIWALENCSQLQYKALSQNIGHEHIMTTYNPYGELNDHARRKAISSIGKQDMTLQHISNDAIFAEMQRRLGK